MNTQLQFLSDTFQFETDATVVSGGEDEDGSYVVTDRTIYYPGGGGQEPDKGRVMNEAGENFPIIKADYNNNRYRLYLGAEIPEEQSVKMIVDMDYRLQNARLHTAGHLLASVVSEKLRWPLLPVKGFHYQHGAYVEFDVTTEMDGFPEEELLQAVMEDISSQLPVNVANTTIDNLYDKEIYVPDGFLLSDEDIVRLVGIGSYKSVPCGGTHLHHTGEIGDFAIKQIRHKKGRVRISYRAGEEDE